MLLQHYQPPHYRNVVVPYPDDTAITGTGRDIASSEVGLLFVAQLAQIDRSRLAGH
jgi:hypothetical protein